MYEPLYLNASQMQYLSKLGVDTSSGSIVLKHVFCKDGHEYYEPMLKSSCEISGNDVISFTLADILYLFPRYQFYTVTGGYQLKVIPKIWDHVMPYPTTIDNSMLGAAYKMVCLLARKNIL